MSGIKRFFKQNSHNTVFKAFAGFGRSLNRFYENRNHDIFSNGEGVVLKKISGTNPSVIIDGGANIGDYSLLINSIIPKAKVYSFEPVEGTFTRLLENVKNIENIKPVKKGLFKENCSSQINLFDSDEHSSLYDIEGLNNKPGKSQRIDLICGDDFLSENKLGLVDFLKLDIEGAEYDALLGFKESIAAGRIKAVQFEYGYINITTKRLLIDYYSYFESNNYIVGKIFPKVVEFRKYDFKYEDFIGPNFIAVKKTETELIKLLANK
jgi:FkbM family methyltransferase